MIQNWITFGMSVFDTPGFQDTSRLMTSAWSGSSVYVEPPKPFSAWKKLDGTVLRWQKSKINDTTVVYPPLPFPSRLDPLGWRLSFQASSFDRQMRACIGKNWRDQSVVYVTNWTPHLEPLISRIQPKYLVVDFVDDVLKFPYHWDVQRVTDQLRRIVSKATVVVGVSPALREYVEREFGATCTVLPNGVNTNFLSPTSHTTPERIQQLSGRYRVGFAGTLNHWIDYEGIGKLAETYPEDDYVLMGKRGHLTNLEQERTLERVAQLENVHEFGPILYDELPNYLHHLDILLLPRIPSRSSEASSPLKLYEYMAVGNPIVTSGFPITPSAKGLLYHSDSPTGLIASMRRAKEELDHQRVGEIREMRQSFARENTWERRIGQITELMTH